MNQKHPDAGAPKQTAKAAQSSPSILCNNGASTGGVVGLQRFTGNHSLQRLLNDSQQHDYLTLRSTFSPTGLPPLPGVRQTTGARAQTSHPVTLQRQEGGAGAACSTRFAPARNFAQLINLVREAETRLGRAGITSVEDKIHTLRGIYYGTTWSADFAAENSPVRNAAFQIYTASSTPNDPRTILDCGLFEALRNSQDVSDGPRHVDFGHLIIGMDARRSWTARNANIPGQGGTGLEIVTWLGDLGGGAGMLSFRRVSNPRLSAMSVFRGSDFGGSINLEGDLAGYLVARDTSTTTDAPGLQFAPGQTLAQALENYLIPTGPSSDWNNRCRLFLEAIHGQFDSSGSLTNRGSLVATLKQKIEDFGSVYLINRLRQTGRLNPSVLRSAGAYLPGASQEVAEIFVDTLTDCHAHHGNRLAASGSGPTPSAPSTTLPGTIQTTLDGMERAEQLDRMRRRAGELIDEYWPF